MKTCTRCGQEKPSEEFYQQKRYTKERESYYRVKGECKTCSIELSSAWQLRNPESRAKIQRRYASTSHGKEAVRRSYASQSERHPERIKARGKLSNAIRRGKIQKQPCQVCGNLRVEAHHHDYSKPLDVVWLCGLDHRRQHSYERERRNQTGVSRIAASGIVINPWVS